jgi:hypothetical protein
MTCTLVGKHLFVRTVSAEQGISFSTTAFYGEIGMSKHVVSLLKDLFNGNKHGGSNSWHGHSKSSGDHGSRHDENGQNNSHGSYQRTIYSEVLSKGVEKLRQNKRLAILIAVGLLVVGSIFLVCVVWLAVRVIGLAAPLFVDIEKNGLKGLVDTIVTSLTTIWQGSAK